MKKNNFNFGNGPQVVGNNNTVNQYINDPSARESTETPPEAAWKSDLLDLVATGQIDTALKQLVMQAPGANTRKMVVALLGRLSQLEVDQISGVLQQKEMLQELNSIRESAIQLILRTNK